MPFGGLLTAGIIGGGSILGGALAGRQSKQQKDAAQAQTDAIRQQMEISKQLSPIGINALTSAANYWSPLLSGNRQQMMQFLGPEISSIINQYGAASRQASEFMPRGGMTASFRGELPFQQASQIGNLMFGMRPLAASQLTGIGGTALSGGLGGASGAAGGASALGGLLLNQRGQAFNQAAAIGSGIYNIAKSIDWSKIFGGGGSSITDMVNSGQPVAG